MSMLFLSKEGKIFVEEDGEHHLVEPRKVLKTLNYQNFELEEGFTLRSYMNLFFNYPLLRDIEDWIQEYLIETELSPKSGCINEEMPNAYIEIRNIIELDHAESEVESYFYDDGQWMHQDDRKMVECNKRIFTSNYHVYMINPDDDDDTHYAIEFTPLKKLLDVPLVVNENVKVVFEHTDKANKHSFREEVYESMSGMKFYDFMTEIIYEISFLGSPESRDSELDVINERMKEVSEGKIEMVSSEDARKRIEETIKNVVDERGNKE